ncbi:U20-lycotoxin-Ls1d, partial [Stegodyphus mimosarum]
MKTKLFILLVICIVVAASEKYCPRLRDDKCPVNYKKNDCCVQNDCAEWSICCKLPCGNVCKHPSDTPTNGIALKDGEECELGTVYPPTGFEWLFGKKG